MTERAPASALSWHWPSAIASYGVVAGVVAAMRTHARADGHGFSPHALAIQLAVWAALTLLVRLWLGILDIGVRRLQSSAVRPLSIDATIGLGLVGIFGGATYYWVLLPSMFGSTPVRTAIPVVVIVAVSPWLVRGSRALGQLGRRLLTIDNCDGASTGMRWALSVLLIAGVSIAWVLATRMYDRMYFAVHQLSALGLLMGGYFVVRRMTGPAGAGRPGKLAWPLQVAALVAIALTVAATPERQDRTWVLSDPIIRPTLQMLPAEDRDGDGFDRKFAWFRGRDCDDDDPSIHPNAEDIAGNGIDENCYGGDLEEIPHVLRPPARPHEVAEAFSPRRNILFVALDALRFEHGTRNGFSKRQAPRLTKLAERSAFFSGLRVCSTRTSESVRMMFGSRPPPVDTDTAVGHLGDLGYHTIHHSECFFGTKPNDDFQVTGGRALKGKLRFDDRGTVKEVAGMLGELPQPFFMYLHLVDLHFPHRATKPCRKKDSAKKRYGCLLRRLDRNVGRLMKALENQGLLKNTVIVMLGDHGEELGEHGAVAHANSLYDVVVKVPMFVLAPGESPRRLDAPMNCFDVMPTVLDAAGIAAPDNAIGRSYFRGAPAEPSPQWSVLDYKEIALRSVVHDGAKLILDMQSGESIYYDLDDDPHERLPLGRPGKDRVEPLTRMMDAWLSKLQAAATD